jgi:hypothetical protein
VRAATQASVIGVAILHACSALAAAGPRPPTVPIFFDARDPFARPMVHVQAFGRARTMLVDTGAHVHVMGPTAAGVSPESVKQGEPFQLDCDGRAVVGIRVPVADFGLSGWPSLGDELWVASWGEWSYRDKTVDRSAPRFDGVLAPIRLAGKDQVVVLDFTDGTMSIGTWKEAGARLAAADVALAPSSVGIGADAQLVMPVTAGGRTVRMALDTGAPSSAMFVPRGGDLPDGLTAVGERVMSIRAGEVSATLRFSTIERIEPLETTEASRALHLDGLIGMDVLRTCVLAFDSESFRARCVSPPSPFMSLRSTAGPTSRPRRTIVQVGDGVVMRPRADGGYDWIGAHSAARIGRDGRLSFSAGSPEERRWFEEQVGGLLTTLARTRDRERIADALAALPRYLALILDDTRLSLLERRRILFLLWDEMAEPDDPERGWAGARARELIDAFIQRRLPAGTPGAYSAAEIAAFNRPRAKATTFNPYAVRSIERHNDRDNDP